jgi:hypothetical protein
MSVEIAYDKAQLRSITKSFKAMSDEGIEAAKRESSALAEFLQLNLVLIDTNNFQDALLNLAADLPVILFIQHSDQSSRN